MMDKLGNLWAKRGVGSARVASTMKSFWAGLNSPIVIALVSAVALNFIARSYSLRDEAAKDMTARRDKLDSALTELQQRVSYLKSADSTWSSRCNYMRPVADELDTVRGDGKYVATSPEYKNVNISIVLMEAERSSGVPDPGYDSSRWIGAFSARPPWSVFLIRTELPWLQKYVFLRTFGVISGIIPVREGDTLTERQQKEIGIPTFKELEREADDANTQLNRAIDTRERSKPLRCK